MTTKGLYKDVDEEAGEVVFMDWGSIETFQTFMPRHHYEVSGLLPPFEYLPTYEEYRRQSQTDQA
ncbi:hypothetical protein G7077_03015 [Sphingomonas piscis]|uniref:Uncharacterized protein n=1 Tax=Sphingomonas piscis TaxID=2714943 RepID=A0A6G7YMR2_9SPHN|nr:hypothetical protein [Sphingomonas piscis]QIK78033.1 hypothetical protein G7077_03015 [Sphingomonas piscis]